MKIVLPYSHVDARHALRLLCWLDFLGGVQFPFLVVASQRATRTPAHAQIKDCLARHFPTAQLRVLPDQDERGWPRSSTHMFAHCLRWAEDDMLFIEPDAVPLTPTWAEELEIEFRRSGRTFCGMLVEGPAPTPPHMSGIAIYGRQWRQVAPKLGDFNSPGPTGAWDVDNCDQILSDFHPTLLIQHEWRRNKEGAKRNGDAAAVNRLRPGAVLYHQCKTGVLMHELAPDFRDHPLTKELLPHNTGNTMPRYFLSKETSKVLTIGGQRFEFEAAHYVPATSSWWSILAVQDAAAADLLSDAVAAGTVKEISEEDYRAYLIKKKNAKNVTNSIELPQFRAPSSGVASQQPAVVVEGRLPRSANTGPVSFVEPEALSDALAPKALPTVNAVSGKRPGKKGGK